jgi:hypothetical protein
MALSWHHPGHCEQGSGDMVLDAILAWPWEPTTGSVRGRAASHGPRPLLVQDVCKKVCCVRNCHPMGDP